MTPRSFKGCNKIVVYAFIGTLVFLVAIRILDLFIRYTPPPVPEVGPPIQIFDDRN